jgi:hypothetical protein
LSNPIRYWTDIAASAEAAAASAVTEARADNDAIARTAPNGLLDGNFGALPILSGEVLDPRVQHASHTLEHFDPGITKMRACVFRPDVIQECFDLRRGDVAEEAAVPMLMRRALLFVHLRLLHFHC